MDLTIIKDGVTLLKYDADDGNKRYAICSCGNVEEVSTWYYSNHTCNKCGNKQFLKLPNNSNDIVQMPMGGVYQVVSKDDSGFIIERVNVSAKVDVKNLKFNLVKGSNIYKADFSFKRGNVLVYKNNEKICASEYHLDCVFKGLNNIKLIEDISTPKNKAVFSVAFNKYGCEHPERVQKMSRALKRLLNVPALQILGAYGLCENALKEIANSVKNCTETKPHLILGYPKYMAQLIKQYEIIPNSRNKNNLSNMNNKFDGTTVKQYFDIFNDESSIASALTCVDNVISLYEDYGYFDIAKLTEYITRDVKLQQGITNPYDACELLKDYIRMMKALEHSYEKYPKSLKKVHDIASMNYKVVESEAKDKEFKEIVQLNSYQNLLYNNKTYAIVIPECVKDVVAEGESLSHCVASYVDDIIKCKCKIVFLRYKDSQNESLITIEIRNSNIKQVKGRNNRKPSVEEIEFVKIWANKKALSINSNDIK